MLVTRRFDYDVHGVARLRLEIANCSVSHARLINSKFANFFQQFLSAAPLLGSVPSLPTWADRPAEKLAAQVVTAWQQSWERSCVSAA